MLRRIFVGFFVVVCMLVLAGLWFFSTLDLNLHKEKIQQLVFERTGRAMSIDGAIEAKLFPWIGLTLTDVSLANAEGFDAMPFASARASDVQLELLPLVSGTFNVKWVQFDGLRLNLQVDEDGVANWEDLLATTTVVETETSQTDV
jgi:AsmA protein